MICLTKHDDHGILWVLFGGRKDGRRWKRTKMTRVVEKPKRAVLLLRFLKFRTFQPRYRVYVWQLEHDGFKSCNNLRYIQNVGKKENDLATKTWFETPLDKVQHVTNACSPQFVVWNFGTRIDDPHTISTRYTNKESRLFAIVIAIVLIVVTWCLH